jgi:hypothetical protein
MRDIPEREREGWGGERESFERERARELIKP